MTKRDVEILKGIAILFMLFHHLFGSIDRYSLYHFTGLIIDEGTTVIIAKDLKVCVSIFAFASGYGMYKRAVAIGDGYPSASWFNKTTVSSYFRLVKDTCFILPILLLLTVGLNLGKSPEAVWGGIETSHDIFWGAVSNILGVAGFFGVDWFVSSWWYLKIAVLFIFLFPAIYILLRRCGGALFLFVAVIFVPYVLEINVTNDNLWRYFPSFIFGMILADWRIIEKLRAFLSKKKYLSVINFAALILTYILSTLIKHMADINFLIQAIQAGILALVASLYLSNVPRLSRVLCILGNNSKYMWLLHVFIYGQLLRDFIFGMKNIWLVLLVCTGISLISSIVLKWVFETIICKPAKRAFDSLYKDFHTDKNDYNL